MSCDEVESGSSGGQRSLVSQKDRGGYLHGRVKIHHYPRVEGKVANAPTPPGGGGAWSMGWPGIVAKRLGAAARTSISSRTTREPRPGLITGLHRQAAIVSHASIDCGWHDLSQPALPKFLSAFIFALQPWLWLVDAASTAAVDERAPVPNPSDPPPRLLQRCCTESSPPASITHHALLTTCSPGHSFSRNDTSPAKTKKRSPHPAALGFFNSALVF